MKIKALFLDLDGTMLPFGGTLATPATNLALEAAHDAGYRLFVATGRHLPNISGVDLSLFDGIVSLNGQYCVTNGEVIRSHVIDQGDIKRLLAYLEEKPFPCAFIEQDQTYVNCSNPLYERVSSFIHLNMPVDDGYRRAANNPILQCLFFLNEEEQAEPLSHMKHVLYTRWHEDFIDVFPKGGGKATGVTAMLDYYDIDPSEILCIGDGENDVSMLKIAGTSVVMGQASSYVKSFADYVTTDVENEGVYRAFRHFGIGDLPPL